MKIEGRLISSILILIFMANTIAISEVSGTIYQIMPFKFSSWGSYGGYLEYGNKYIQDYNYSNCLKKDNLPINWVSQVLLDTAGNQIISASQPFPLKEDYQLAVKGVDIKGNPKLYLELSHAGIVVDSKVLKLFAVGQGCNTYYYLGTMKTQNDKIIQKNFLLIAVHFNVIPGPKAIIIADGVWQISDILQPLCGLDICTSVASCGGSPLIVDANDPAAKYHKIQDAVNAAKNCDTIFVRKGFYKENVNIWNKNITICGDGKGQTIVEADNPNIRVFDFGQNNNQPPASGTIADMTIQKGNSGIRVVDLASLNVENCEISGNKQIGGEGGGGIEVYRGATLAVVGCNISYNDGGFSGGGIYNYYGDVTVINSLISHNHATFGGGIKNLGMLSLLKHSNVSKNYITYYYPNYPGAGIDSYGGGHCPTIDGTSVVIFNDPCDHQNYPCEPFG